MATPKLSRVPIKMYSVNFLSRPYESRSVRFGNALRLIIHIADTNTYAHIQIGYLPDHAFQQQKLLKCSQGSTFKLKRIASVYLPGSRCSALFIQKSFEHGQPQVIIYGGRAHNIAGRHSYHSSDISKTPYNFIYKQNRL